MVRLRESRVRVSMAPSRERRAVGSVSPRSRPRHAPITRTTRSAAFCVCTLVEARSASRARDQTPWRVRRHPRDSMTLTRVRITLPPCSLSLSLLDGKPRSRDATAGPAAPSRVLLSFSFPPFRSSFAFSVRLTGTTGQTAVPMGSDRTATNSFRLSLFKHLATCSDFRRRLDEEVLASVNSSRISSRIVELWGICKRL